MESNGFITLNRKLLKWEWIDDPETLALWVHLLLMANYEESKWHGITIGRGQLVTSVAKLSELTGISTRGLRTRLQRLEKSECISVKATNNASLITICKYDTYQHFEGETDVQLTNLRQTSDKPPTNDRQQYNKNNKNNNIFISSNAPAYVSEEDRYHFDLRDADATQSWRERVCMNNHLTMDALKKELDEFRELSQQRMDAHADVKDYAGHFINTLRNKTNKAYGQQQNTSRLREAPVGSQTEEAYNEDF